MPFSSKYALPPWAASGRRKAVFGRWRGSMRAATTRPSRMSWRDDERRAADEEEKRKPWADPRRGGLEACRRPREGGARGHGTPPPHEHARHDLVEMQRIARPAERLVHHDGTRDR